MNFAQIFEADVANGEGCRTSLFVSGCTHHCKGCFNPDTWDFKYGKEYTKEVEDVIIESLKPVYIQGLTILGGEPMEPANQKCIRPLIERVRREVPKADIWVYSGYTFEELMESKRCHTDDTIPILESIDVLVDGEFHLDEKDVTLKYRGSRNQRVIDMRSTLSSGVVTSLF